MCCNAQRQDPRRISIVSERIFIFWFFYGMPDAVFSLERGAVQDTKYTMAPAIQDQITMTGGVTSCALRGVPS